jgi:hypothetical protein
MIFLSEQSVVSANGGSDSSERKEVECAIDNQLRYLGATRFHVLRNSVRLEMLLGLPLLDDRKCIVPEQRLRRSKILIDDRPVLDATAFFENHRHHRLILAQDIISVTRLCSDDYESDYHLLLSDAESFHGRYSRSMCAQNVS